MDTKEKEFLDHLWRIVRSVVQEVYLKTNIKIYAHIETCLDVNNEHFFQIMFVVDALWYGVWKWYQVVNIEDELGYTLYKYPDGTVRHKYKYANSLTEYIIKSLNGIKTDG